MGVKLLTASHSRSLLTAVALAAAVSACETCVQWILALDLLRMPIALDVVALLGSRLAPSPCAPGSTRASPLARRAAPGNRPWPSSTGCCPKASNQAS